MTTLTLTGDVTDGAGATGHFSTVVTMTTPTPTPDGLRASLSKPKFTMDKEKNKQAQAQNRTLKVYIPKGHSNEEDEAAIVKALLDLYG